MSEKTKIGVVGLGGIAQLVHLPILAKLPNVEIVAVAEINKNRLNSVADKFDISSRYLDYKEMLSSEQLDAVIIATPTNTHLEIALDCLSAKKHLLIEKPVSVNHLEAAQIIKASKKVKKKVMVGMNLRFRPDSMLMKSLANSGELGNIFYVRCGWLRKQSSEEKWFLNKDKSGGGVISDLGILVLDLALWFYGHQKIKSISVQKFSHQTKNVEDSAVGLLRMETGEVINFEVSWGLHSEADTFKMTIYGTKGTAHLNPLRAYRRMDSGRIDYTLSGAANSVNLFKKSYENELKHFISAIRENGPVISTIEESYAMMKLLASVYKSAELKKEVII